MTATEFSGFGMAADLSDTLVVAVSQSGRRPTRTERSTWPAPVARSVIGIVNRRNSDLTDKADGVLYTSDGRDVEMSVASTKAFYAQVAAGVLLPAPSPSGRCRRRAPASVLLAGAARAARRDARGDRTGATRSPRRPGGSPRAAATGRSSATVPTGWPPKRSGSSSRELCYKSIACDVTEDKKHIDLSSEPLILVCAAGLVGSTADDVAKEVAIYRAHKAAPIVIATEGEERFRRRARGHRRAGRRAALAFVLSAVVGHLFGYEAALAIDALGSSAARSTRGDRAAVARASTATGSRRPARTLAEPGRPRFSDGLRSGAYDGHLEASTAVRLASLLRYATGPVPLDAYQLEYGKVGTPEVLVDDLTAALTRAIEELTRPVDAIKHQAKTVTVGISRSEEGLLAARSSKRCWLPAPAATASATAP